MPLISNDLGERVEHVVNRVSRLSRMNGPRFQRAQVSEGQVSEGPGFRVSRFQSFKVSRWAEPEGIG